MDVKKYIGDLDSNINSDLKNPDLEREDFLSFLKKQEDRYNNAKDVERKYRYDVVGMKVRRSWAIRKGEVWRIDQLNEIIDNLELVYLSQKEISKELLNRVRILKDEDADITIYGIFTTSFKKSKLLEVESPALLILKNQARLIKQKINDRFFNMRSEREVKAMRVQYQRYIANIESLISGRDLNTVMYSDSELYFDLINWIKEKEKKGGQYPIMYKSYVSYIELY